MLSQLLNAVDFGETLRICTEKAKAACLWSVSSRENNSSTLEGQLILFFIVILICLEEQFINRVCM